MRKRLVFPHFARSSLRQFIKSDDDHLEYLNDATTQVFAIYDTSLFKKPFILCKNMISSPSHLNILSRLNFSVGWLRTDRQQLARLRAVAARGAFTF